MGCATSTTADAPSIFDGSPALHNAADINDCQTGCQAAVTNTPCHDAFGEFGVHSSKRGDTITGQETCNPLNKMWPARTFGVGVAAVSTSDSKFVPGAERSDSRMRLEDTMRGSDGVTELADIHPDPELRDELARDDGVEFNHTELMSRSDNSAPAESSCCNLSEQSAGNGVICSEPTPHEWSVRIARKRAVAVLHGHTIDPDQYQHRSGDVKVIDSRAAQKHHSDDLCRAWLQNVEIFYSALFLA